MTDTVTVSLRDQKENLIIKTLITKLNLSRKAEEKKTIQMGDAIHACPCFFAIYLFHSPIDLLVS